MYSDFSFVLDCVRTMNKKGEIEYKLSFWADLWKKKNTDHELSLFLISFSFKLSLALFWQTLLVVENYNV